jgi:hypothetical protein
VSKFPGRRMTRIGWLRTGLVVLADALIVTTLTAFTRKRARAAA